MCPLNSALLRLTCAFVRTYVRTYILVSSFFLEMERRERKKAQTVPIIVISFLARLGDIYQPKFIGLYVILVIVSGPGVGTDMGCRYLIDSTFTLHAHLA